jgi:peptide/nickel transport system substrate-binding protein
MKTFRTSLALVAGAALLTLSACGGDSNAEVKEAAAAAGEPTSGGTLRFAVGSDAGCIDPQQVGSNDSIYSARQLVDSLTDQDPETGEIVPWLAEDWEINDEVTEFTFTLQENVTFSNGDPLDAVAVAENFDTAVELGPRATLVAGYLEDYTETEVHDDRTFTVKFSQPNAQFLQATSTHSLGILHPDTVAQSDDERCAGVIGSGPFVLEDYVPNDSITLSGRDDYAWGSSLWENQTAPHVDGIEFEVVPESGVRAGSLQSGQVDVIGNIAPQDEAGLHASGAQLLAKVNPGIPMGLRVNHDNELLDDPEVRHAISLAIDRQEIVDTVYPEDTPVATSALSSTTPDHRDFSDKLGHDPQQAEEILADAGFEPGPDGILERDGERAEFDLLWFNVAATNSAAVELVQQHLGEIGIDITLEEGQTAEWNSRLLEGSYDLNWFNTTRADGDILRGTFSSQLANTFHLEDSELDEVLQRQSTTLDAAERGELLGEAQERLIDDYIQIPVVDLITILAAREGVHGVRFDSGARVHLNDVWIEDAE